MKRFAFKNLITSLLLILIMGGLTMSVFPGLIRENKSISWLTTDAEDESSPEENTHVKGKKEFVSDVFDLKISLLLSNLPEMNMRPSNVSFICTFHMKVPTPPPDNL